MNIQIGTFFQAAKPARVYRRDVAFRLSERPQFFSRPGRRAAGR
jgi:hypothetical protein